MSRAFAKYSRMVCVERVYALWVSYQNIAWNHARQLLHGTTGPLRYTTTSRRHEPTWRTIASHSSGTRL